MDGDTGPHHICSPTVHQADLRFYAERGPILIESPSLANYPLHTSLKRRERGPGIALLQAEFTLIPLTRGGEFLTCGKVRASSSHPKSAELADCPGGGAKLLLGEVTRLEFPGRAPDFTFELLAVEVASQENSEGSSQLPVVALASPLLPLPVAQDCSDWYRCAAGEFCVMWDDRTGPLCVPELSSIDAVAAAHHSRGVVLRRAVASVAKDPSSGPSPRTNLVLTRKAGAPAVVTRPIVGGVSSPVECGAALPQISFVACPLEERNEQVVGVIRPLGAGSAAGFEFELLARGVQFAEESQHARKQLLTLCDAVCEGGAVCVSEPETGIDRCMEPSSMQSLLDYSGDTMMLITAPKLVPGPAGPGDLSDSKNWPQVMLSGPKGGRVKVEAKLADRHAWVPLRCTPKLGQPGQWDCPGAGAQRIYGHVRPSTAPAGEPQVVFELLGIDPGPKSRAQGARLPAAQ